MLPHDPARLKSIFQCLMRAKANPYQNVHLVHVQGDPIEAITSVRGYLENIVHLPACPVTLRTEVHDLLAEIDRFDANSIRGLPYPGTEHATSDADPRTYQRKGQLDIFSTMDELTFEEDVRARYCKVHPRDCHNKHQKVREGIFSALKRRILGSTKARHP